MTFAAETRRMSGWSPSNSGAFPSHLSEIPGPPHQPEYTWIGIPVPPLVDEETWERAQALKKQRGRKARRNTKVLYLLQHLFRCGECGHNFHANSTWSTTNVREGKKYRYELPTPRQY